MRPDHYQKPLRKSSFPDAQAEQKCDCVKSASARLARTKDRPIAAWQNCLPTLPIQRIVIKKRQFRASFHKRCSNMPQFLLTMQAEIMQSHRALVQRGASSRAHFRARSIKNFFSRSFLVIPAARSNSAAASACRPSRDNISPRTLGSRW
jgi:hypothetical protein